MIVSGEGNIPLLMRAGDGNESDKKIFAKIISEYKKQINFASIFVADSALYSQENLKLIEKINWITRVPLTIKKAKDLIRKIEIQPRLSQEIKEEVEEQELIRELQEKGYIWSEAIINYGGIEQRWLVIESSKRKESDCQKLSKKITKEKQKATKLLKKLEKEVFDNSSQARYQLKGINKKLKLFQIKERSLISSVAKNKKKGYVIKGELEKQNLEIEQRKKAAGRFILATNLLDKSKYSSATILANYKNQQGCERGFGFLKDPLFFADSFFVEKPSRIETLLFFMSLCLLVYNLGQRELRNNLKRAKTGVKNQVGKITDNPTLRWIFQSFQGIHFVCLQGIQQVINLTKNRQKTLSFLPLSCLKYYFLSG